LAGGHRSSELGRLGLLLPTADHRNVFPRAERSVGGATCPGSAGRRLGDYRSRSPISRNFSRTNYQRAATQTYNFCFGAVTQNDAETRPSGRVPAMVDGTEINY